MNVMGSHIEDWKVLLVAVMMSSNDDVSQKEGQLILRERPCLSLDRDAKVLRTGPQGLYRLPVILEGS